MQRAALSSVGGIRYSLLTRSISTTTTIGKSTLFNALTETQGAEAANYPFCTIEPNSGIVSVPDPRLDVLGKINSSVKVVPATLEFVDVAGLIKGASAGEGLGNAFLATIRQCDAIVHVVRCFEDENVIHVRESCVTNVYLFNTMLCRRYAWLTLRSDMQSVFLMTLHVCLCEFGALYPIRATGRWHRRSGP